MRRTTQNQQQKIQYCIAFIRQKECERRQQKLRKSNRNLCHKQHVLVHVYHLPEVGLTTNQTFANKKQNKVKTGMGQTCSAKMQTSVLHEKHQKKTMPTRDQDKSFIYRLNTLLTPNEQKEICLEESFYI